MKFTATDELNNFDYHDATIIAMYWHDGNFVWRVDAINATTENSQNSHPKHMCINDAEIIFKDARVESIVFNAYKSSYTSSAGVEVITESVDAKVAAPEEFDEIIKKTTDSSNYIFCMYYDKYVKTADGRFFTSFDIGGSDDGMGYVITVSFSQAAVSWDEFHGEAWYEHPKWKAQAKVAAE